MGERARRDPLESCDGELVSLLSEMRVLDRAVRTEAKQGAIALRQQHSV
jgi:hypothetical protein